MNALSLEKVTRGVTNNGFQAIGLVLPASEKWGLVEGCAKCLWSLHTMWNKHSGYLCLSSSPFGLVLTPSVENDERSLSPKVPFEVKFL